MKFRAERHGSVNQGYFPIKETTIIHPDLVEGWVFCRRAFDLDDNPNYKWEDYWPEARFEESFRKIVLEHEQLILPLMQSILQYLKVNIHSYDKRLTNTNFGLDYNNYIGSLHQQNNLHPTWVDFFINERLQPQIKLARDNNEIDSTTILKFENLYKKLDEVFPKEKPALLHGDLWSGNFMSDEKGESVIMDPTVYYGHREMDIAMAKLFGGFDAEFYSSYNEHYPLENGWEQRINVCNLYPLMVHVNLFGGGYLGQVKSILSKF